MVAFPHWDLRRKHHVWRVRETKIANDYYSASSRRHTVVKE